MNFIEAYKKGQAGANKGLPMGNGLEDISAAINDLQRATIYVVAGAAKGGKSTFVDAGFVIGPCLFVINNNLNYLKYTNEGLTTEQIKTSHNISYIDFELLYYSYEIDRISKEFDFVAHFLNYDFGIESITLDDGVLFEGKKVIDLSANYLRGILSDDNGKIITVKPTIFEAIKTVYENRIIPLFGEYNAVGNLVKPGIIKFFENKENPTGIRNFLIKHAELNGKITYSKFTGADGKIHKRIVKYEPNNPEKYTFVVTDHLRKLIPERGFNAKQTVDKFSEYAVELKISFKYSFVHIIHLNRSMTDSNRIKQQDDMLYPNSDDVKETGEIKKYLYLFLSFVLVFIVYLYNKIFNDKSKNLLPL